MSHSPEQPLNETTRGRQGHFPWLAVNTIQRLAPTCPTVTGHNSNTVDADWADFTTAKGLYAAFIAQNAYLMRIPVREGRRLRGPSSVVGQTSSLLDQQRYPVGVCEAARRARVGYERLNSQIKRSNERGWQIRLQIR